MEVFGRSVEPGQLIHADKHGFMVIPRADEAGLLDAARFMDSNECRTMIPAARQTAGMPTAELLAAIDKACDEFRKRARKRFGEKGKS